MKTSLFALAPVLLLTACANHPTADLTAMKQNIDAAKAGNFGDLLVHMHQAESNLDQAESLYQKMQNGSVSADQRQHAEQVAKRAAEHRANAERAFGQLLRPLEARAENQARTVENLDYRLSYIENLHVPQGLAIPKENVYFDFGRSQLLTEQQPKLQKIVNFLKEYPLFAMELKGYADTVGSKIYNRHLAEKRNQAVLDHLRKLGLPKQTIVTIAIGEAAGPDEMQNPDNRRVEVHPYVHGRYAERIAVNTNNQTTAEEPDLDLDLK